jgi:hypothetical protein
VGGRQTPTAQAPSAALSLGLKIEPGLALPIAAWSLTTALGIALFGLFIRRPARQQRGPFGPSVAISPSAAAVSSVGSGVVADGQWTNPAEAHLPRWLRPSLREQRWASDRDMGPTAHEPVRFDSPPPRGVERRTIGYRLVRVSDEPDEIRSREVGRLDRGDEVDVTAEHEGFLKVATPDGLEGWVPRIAILG